MRLPNEFFAASKVETNPSSFVARLKSVMNCLRPVPTLNHSRKNIFIHKSLPICKRVFVRVDRVRTPLETPYDVIMRSEKNYVLKITIKKNPTPQSTDRRRVLR